MAQDIGPVFSFLTAAILLGGSFSFFIVSTRYPPAIKRALILYAFGNLAISAGTLTETFFKPIAPELAQTFNLVVASAGTGLYYLSYRSLQERVSHWRMLGTLYILFLAAIAYAQLLAHNANVGFFAICVLDIVLFSLAARDLLFHFRGRGRAHVIQGVAMALYAPILAAWGISFLVMPAVPVVTIHYGDSTSLGLSANCFGAAFGAVNFLLICNDEFNTRLRTLVGTDPLTGVANRRKLMERGAEELARAHRYQHPLTVVAIDLDHFKKLNDTFGHAAGDRALCEAARVCLAALRDIDLVARSGGEEFTALLPQTPLVQGLEVAERLRQAVADIDLQWGSAKVPLTASFGVAELHPEDVSIDHVIARADRALYRSKAEGRNRVSHAMADGFAPEAPLTPV